MRLAPLSALAALIVPALALAGPLTPPAGPVASTHKTLSQVEPRTPLSQATTPGDADSVFRITSPGSYYLTADMIVPASKHGIEIGTYGVTIDLAGFSIYGLASSRSGIISSFASSTLTVRNGRINGMSQAPVSAMGTTVIEDVVIERCGWSLFLEGDGSIVRRCRVYEISSDAIWIGGAGTLIEDCLIDQSAVADPGASGIFANEFGVVVRRCVISGPANAGIGIELLAGGNDTDLYDVADGNTVRGFQRGIYLGGASVARGNIISGASQIGIDLNGGENLVEGNRIFKCPTGIKASVSYGGDQAIRNSLRQCTTPLSATPGHDFAPAQTAAACTNPNANVVN